MSGDKGALIEKILGKSVRGLPTAISTDSRSTRLHRQCSGDQPHPALPSQQDYRRSGVSSARRHSSDTCPHGICHLGISGDGFQDLSRTVRTQLR